MPFLDLFGHEVVHFLLSIASAAVAVFFYVKSKRGKKSAPTYMWILAGGFIGEFLLDIDHLFDYVLAFGLNFRVGKFLSGEMFEKSNKIFLPLHSWELLVVLVPVVYFVKNNRLKYFFLAMTLGFLFHMVYDQFYNHITPFGYSWFFRLYHNFDPGSVVLSGGGAP